MKILYLLFLFTIPYLSQSQPQINLCYVSCKQGGCLREDPLTCTACDQGTILLNNRCASAGSQSQPIRILQPNGPNSLDSRALQLFSNRNQVSCRRNIGSLTYLNVTISNLQPYTVRIPMILIKSPHKYINLKFNAVLFNQTNGPLSQIRVLMINGQNDKRIFDGVIDSNQGVLLCGQTSFNMPFFVNVNVSSSSQSLLVSISTIRPKDQLGLADLNVFYGNCHIGCVTCEGPGPNQCLSCQNLLIYVKETKSCNQCPEKFYKVNELCIICPYNCQTCQYSSTQGGPVCIKCETSIVDSNSVAPQCKVSQYVKQSLNQLIFQNNDGWKSAATVDNVVTLCGSYSVIGGVTGFGGYSISKTFVNLPVHKKIWLKFSFFLIDQLPDTTYRNYITVDGVPVGKNQGYQLSSNQLSTNQCGLQNNQFITSVFIKDIPHFNSETTISITGQSNYFGIRDFVLGVSNLTDLAQCDQVDLNNKCIRCRNGYRLNPVNTSQAQCSDCPDGTYQNADTCIICPIYCQTCKQVSGSIPCLSCSEPLVLDAQSGTCIDKESNLYTVGLSQNWNSSVTGKQWKFSPKLQNKGLDKCGPYSILGSSSIKYRNISIVRNFQSLPNHQGVYVHLYLFLIDNFDANNLKGPEFKLNNKVIPYNISKNGYDICGNNSFDSIQKIVLYDPTHSASNLNLQISAGSIKLGISNLLIFLSKCQQCKNYGISYELETIPMYSASSTPNPEEKGLKSKIIFNQKVYITNNQTQLFKVQLLDQGSPQIQSLKGYFLSQTPDPFLIGQNANGSFGRGQKDPYAITDSYFHANRQLVLFQNLIKDQYKKDALANLLSPDSAYGQKDDKQNFIQSLRIQPALGQFSRYDDIYSVIDTESERGQKYRANTRNLMNLFRGISILALFIGLISFFFNLSEIFDDLFVMCQIIFVHIFIQSPWISATMKLPVGAMNLVQFMAWLPLQARSSIQRGIIPSNHYQRSPIVYEQYWRDISFARTIYHTVIFLAVMVIVFWFLRLIQAIRQPSINKILQITHIKYHYIENFLYGQTSRWFVFLDRVMRFTFFTVMWASCLQFIHFKIEPSGFMGWNSALCIIMFIFYFLYIILGYLYLHNQAKITQSTTFRQKFAGIRIRKQTLWYFMFRYFKLLAIAFIIGQLYNVNPLAVLIPLIFIHIFDAVILIVFKPYLHDLKNQDYHIISKCSKNYWLSYLWSHIVQNFLFVVLQIIMIIMYGVRSSASKQSYLSIGYACCAFIIIMFIVGLFRLIHGMIRFFEICYDDISSRQNQIKSQEDIGPLQLLGLMRPNQNNTDVFFQTDTNRNMIGNRRPSIDNKI